MQWIVDLLNRWVFHLDATLFAFAAQMPGQVLFLLFLIIFLETGLVVTPFLPGDSFIFAAGTLAAAGSIDPLTAYMLMMLAAILGNMVNFAIGHFFGNWLLTHRIFAVKPSHIQKTEAFFEKYGAATIIVSRFFPIVRTIAPFLAGVGSMRFPYFMAFNIIGAVLWITSFFWSGYWLGNIPFIKEHFTEFVLGIIVVSLIPAIYHFLRQRFKRAE